MEVWGGGGEQVVRTSKDLKKKYIYIYIYISIKTYISQVGKFSTFLCID